MSLATKLAYTAGLLILCVGVQLTHLKLDQSHIQDTTPRAEALPSEEALGLLSLTYSNVVGDYYWLRAIYDFGTDAQHNEGFPNLSQLSKLVISLDPDFEAAYSFIGKALSVHKSNVPTAMSILAQGRERFPDSWELASLEGFNAYMYQQDFNLAAKSYADAARNPDAPPVFGQFATKLAAEARNPKVGLMLVNHMLETLEDETLIAFYQERQALLILEQSLIDLQGLINRFETQESKRPTHLEDLVTVGLVRQLPDSDPLGGQYFINDQGRAATTSESKRLRLPEKAKDTLQ